MTNQPNRQLKLKVADIIIEARCVEPGIGLETCGTNQRFLTDQGEPDCVLDVHYGALPDVALEQQLFDSGSGPWALYSSGQKLVFQMLGSGQGKTFAHRVALFEPGFKSGDLFIRKEVDSPGDKSTPGDGKKSLDPFLCPLDEWLTVNLLAQGRGLHVHALGIVHEGQGMVFCGVSGAGKSTLAELWKKRPVKILSDDRIALRKREGRIWAYGTPWHGDARVCNPDKVPLAAIYFITHGQENRILPLSAGEVATRLLSRCFPTFYFKQGIEYALSFITELAQEVPCYELQFTPDQRAVDRVLSHVTSHKSGI